MRFASAPVSLMSVSKSSMKSNSADLTLSSCLFVSFRFLFYYAVHSYVVYRNLFDRAVVVLLDGYCGVASGIVCCHRVFGTASSELLEMVDSASLWVSYSRWVSSLLAWSCVALCGTPSPKSLKNPQPMRDSLSFLFSWRSFQLISLF